MTMEDVQNDNFPVGMRVLAVDDDPTCLKLLEGLLRRCDYQVTTTNQAIEALRLLRENKDHFDLVISDVHMPDMDGFKLLELVGLEMDLPVIMLSGHSDPKLVMRGITHGACDYLLKPVRIEELKNIWQHVIRKKKSDPKDNRSGHGHMSEKRQGAGEGGQSHVTTGENDANAKLNRKRKDQDEDDEDDSDGNAQSNEDPSAQKKPRVVWSVELHRKFVNAVNQLGVDKAVPKRILDLMNVEKLTRENVASHLQKYRLYLKRISNVATQQANFAAALGGKDLGYLPIGSFDGYSDLRALTGTNPLPKHTLASYQASGVTGQLNSPSNLGLHGLPSTGMIQLGRSQTPAHLMNSYGKFPHLSHAGTQHRNPLQGMPHSLELDQLQHNKYSSSMNDSTAFPLGQPQLRGTGAYSGAGMASSNSRNTIHGTSDDSTMVQGLQQLSYSGSLSNQTTSRMTHLNPTTFGVGTGVSSCPPDHNRLNGTWQSPIPLGGSSSNALPIDGDAFHGGEFLPQNSRANISCMSSQVENNSLDFSTGNVGGAAGGDARLLNFANTQNNAGHSLNYLAKQELDDHLLFQSTPNTSIPSQNMGPTSDFRRASVDSRLSGQTTVTGSFLAQNVEIGKPNNGNQMMLKEHNPLEQSAFQNGFFLDNNESASFDDLMTLVRRV